MEIIGEKINGTRKRVARAIKERDAAFVQDLALKQAEAGSSWLDVNAGTHPDREADDLVWLVQTVQMAIGVPLCLDSANPDALAAVIRVVKQTPVINSISGEPQRLEGILPLVAEHGCPVIALAMDEKRMTMGLSNISFGLPARSYINRAFLVLVLEAGLDSAIVDPLDREMMATLVAAQLVLGRDCHCLNYTRSYRAGLFG